MSACGQCGRDNGPKRRFCGGCGVFVAPVCKKCDFATNTVDDKFCGGCGEAMAVTVRGADPKLTGNARELAGLFTFASVPAAKAAALPETNVSQDDIDRLFSRGSP